MAWPGLSVAADSLSAIKYAKVTPVRNETGLAVDFITEGEYPCYGNDDDRVDRIAVEIVTSSLWSSKSTRFIKMRAIRFRRSRLHLM